MTINEEGEEEEEEVSGCVGMYVYEGCRNLEE